MYTDNKFGYSTMAGECHRFYYRIGTIRHVLTVTGKDESTLNACRETEEFMRRWHMKETSPMGIFNLILRDFGYDSSAMRSHLRVVGDMPPNELFMIEGIYVCPVTNGPKPLWESVRDQYSCAHLKRYLTSESRWELMCRLSVDSFDRNVDIMRYLCSDLDEFKAFQEMTQFMPNAPFMMTAGNVHCRNTNPTYNGFHRYARRWVEINSPLRSEEYAVGRAWGLPPDMCTIKTLYDLLLVVDYCEIHKCHPPTGWSAARTHNANQLRAKFFNLGIVERRGKAWVISGIYRTGFAWELLMHRFGRLAD